MIQDEQRGKKVRMIRPPRPGVSLQLKTLKAEIQRTSDPRLKRSIRYPCVTSNGLNI